MLCLWRGDWLFIGRPQANRPHRHVAASLLCGLHQPFELEVRGEQRLTRLALVAPEVPQALTPPADGAMLIAHLDPDTDAWLAVAGHLANGRESCDLPFDAAWVAMAEAVLAQPDATAAGALRAALLERLRCPAPPLDARVRVVAKLLRDAPPEQLDVAALAEPVALSASRLARLFREQTGVTLRRFLLHLKAAELFHLWRSGMSVSALAAASRFYDQPHLVRTTREMFDALPSEYMAGGFHILDCTGQAGLAPPGGLASSPLCSL